MLLGFKTELIVNNKQRTLLAQHAGCARFAYNWGLGLCKDIITHNKANPAEKIKFPSAIDLHKWLVALVKPEKSWMYNSSKCAPQYALRALRDAFDRFFKRVSDFPKFKKKGLADSFTLDGSFKIDHDKIRVPVIGWLKTYERLPQGAVVKSVTIRKKAYRWFLSFKIEVDLQDTTKLKPSVGVDLGVKSLATLSTGEVIEGPKAYRRNEAKLKRIQRAASRKPKDSKNQTKCYQQLAKQHYRVANIRKDSLHQLTTYLAKNHGLIGIEDLNVSGMLSNHKLAKAISDMGFYEFKRQLEYKTKLYGSKLVVIDRWFPSSKTCSNCGCVKESLSLSERVFKCEDCGLEIDRDRNASINIETTAINLAEV